MRRCRELATPSSKPRSTSSAGPARDYEQRWIDLIARGIGEGVLRADLDPKMTAYGILGMVNWMHQWYRPGGRFSASEIGEQYAASAASRPSRSIG